MFVGVGTFWQRLGHKLFDIHSPAGLELNGCLICGMPSRDVFLDELEQAYKAGLAQGLKRMNNYVDDAYQAGIETGKKEKI